MNDFIGANASVRRGAPAPYSLFVSSTDSFADCWGPFFALLERYWKPDLPAVYLNTESEGFSHPAIDVRATRVAPRAGEKPPWGEAVLRGLANLESPALLYLQDDYFISGCVRTEIIERFAPIVASGEVACIRLWEAGNSGPWHISSTYPSLYEVSWRSPYVVSLQAALWHSEALRSLIQPEESPWEFERRGTRRARRIGARILTVGPEHLSEFHPEVFPYVRTGVVRGRWNPEVVPLFKSHNLDVDYSGRGFWAQPPAQPQSTVRVMGHHVRNYFRPLADRAIFQLSKGRS